MSNLLNKHGRIGECLASVFRASDPIMLEWAEVGFAIKELQKLPDQWRKHSDFGEAYDCARDVETILKDTDNG
jgi:hypothetical protein